MSEWYGHEYILNCECPECTGEAIYERNEARKIKAWDEQNIHW